MQVANHEGILTDHQRVLDRITRDMEAEHLASLLTPHTLSPWLTWHRSTTSATMWLGHGSKSKHQEFCNSALCGQNDNLFMCSVIFILLWKFSGIYLAIIQSLVAYSLTYWFYTIGTRTSTAGQDHFLADVPDLVLHSGMLCQGYDTEFLYRLKVAMVCCGCTEIGQKYSYLLKLDKSFWK